MSAELFANISDALPQTIASSLARQWNRRAVLAQMLPVTQEMQNGIGKNVAWDIEVSGATAASFVDGADVGSGEFSYDPIVLATTPWGAYRSAFSISNFELNAAASSMAGPVALGQLVGERMDGAFSKICSVINSDLYIGDGTDGSGNPTIIGLNTSLAATGSYAGLSQGSYSEWAGNVSANAGTPRALTFDLLAALEAQIYNTRGEGPKFLITTPSVVTKYEGLFTPGVRVVGNNGGDVYNAGAGKLYWRGLEVVRDRDCPAGTLYMLNQDYMDIRVLPWASVPDGVTVKSVNLPSSNGMGMTSTALSCNVYPLARTGSAVKFVCEMYLQMRVKNRNAGGILKDIAS